VEALAAEARDRLFGAANIIRNNLPSSRDHTYTTFAGKDRRGRTTGADGRRFKEINDDRERITS
jgi:hypothetical protein